MRKRKPKTVVYNPIARVLTGYVCTVTADYEIANTRTVIFPSLDALRRDQKTKRHQKECGYVKVKIVPVKRESGSV